MYLPHLMSADDWTVQEKVKLLPLVTADCSGDSINIRSCSGSAEVYNISRVSSVKIPPKMSSFAIDSMNDPPLPPNRNF